MSQLTMEVEGKNATQSFGERAMEYDALLKGLTIEAIVTTGANGARGVDIFEYVREKVEGSHPDLKYTRDDFDLDLNWVLHANEKVFVFAGRYFME